MVAPLLLPKNIGYDILDDESVTDVCSLVFNICEKKVPFQVSTAVLNVKYSEMWWEDENIIDMGRRSPRSSTRRISARLLCSAHESLANATHRRNVSVPDPAHSDLGSANMCSRLKLCRWINSNPIIFVTFFHRPSPFYPRWSQRYKKTPIYGIVITHTALSKATTNTSLSQNVWCGVAGDQLTGLYIFPQHLTGDI